MTLYEIYKNAMQKDNDNFPKDNTWVSSINFEACNFIQTQLPETPPEVSIDNNI